MVSNSNQIKLPTESNTAREITKFVNIETTEPVITLNLKTYAKILQHPFKNKAYLFTRG